MAASEGIKLASDPRVVFLTEPSGLESAFRSFTQATSPSQAWWTDACLSIRPACRLRSDQFAPCHCSSRSSRICSWARTSPSCSRSRSSITTAGWPFQRRRHPMHPREHVPDGLPVQPTHAYLAGPTFLSSVTRLPVEWNQTNRFLGLAPSLAARSATLIPDGPAAFT